jgi:protein gp37
MGHQAYRQGFELTLQPQKINLPLHWKKPHTIFVNSMSDLFHEAIPLEYIQQVFDVMGRANWHRFQILTKRAARLRELDAQLSWEPHIWMGVSVEKQAYVSRIDDLRQTHAHLKFLSLEPLLGPLLNLDLRDIDWVIVGGESGPRARPMDPQWVLAIRDQCRQAGVPFFFKQWGGTNKKKTGRLLDGKVWDEMPAVSSILLHSVPETDHESRRDHDPKQLQLIS